MTRAPIRDIKELQGKKMGVPGFNSAGYFLLREYLSKHGMEPGKDYTLLQAGDSGPRLLALQNNFVDGVGNHVLRCDAAAAFGALNQAYAARFGAPLCVTDSYRTFDAQVRLYAQKPALAAVPGTSNHGWGLALDLCGGAQSFGSPQYAWLRANAPSAGWVNPEWAWPGRGREEPWHWEFGV
jgi:hypothetical protein